MTKQELLENVYSRDAGSNEHEPIGNIQDCILILESEEKQDIKIDLLDKYYTSGVRHETNS